MPVDSPPTPASTSPRFDGPQWKTPAMRQYVRFKTAHPDCLLLFRMGDFYELFGDDAKVAHRALGITLTERSKGMPMAGVPFHSIEGYLRRLVEGGHRVAICDQVQDPKDAKGVVDRAVTRVVTPGTLVDESLLHDAHANRTAALGSIDGESIEIAAIELSTGDFELLAVPAARVLDELHRLGPAEIVIGERDDGVVPVWARTVEQATIAPVTRRPDWIFRADDAAPLLREHFGVRTLEGFGFDEARDVGAIGTAGALLRYLLDTQSPDGDGAARAARLGQLRPPRRREHGATLALDATTLRSLEIERTMRSGSTDGSLLAVLQHGRTPMGRRLLREWVCWPVRSIDEIGARQRAIGALVDDRTGATELREALGSIQDVARIGGRLGMRRATPRDLAALGRSTGMLATLREVLDQRPAFERETRVLGEIAEDLAPLADRLREECVDAPPTHLREGGVFRDGIDETLDEARELQRDAGAWLARYQAELVETHSIGSLKVGFNKVFGYYIEITHANRDRVPDCFTRKQTLKNAERYITPELKTFEEKVTTAEQRAIEREKAMFDALCEDVAESLPRIVAFAEIVARLDCLAGLAEAAVRGGWCRPDVNESDALEIEGGRHPVLEATLREGFVANDAALGGGHASLALITGPNMAGKSTYIRQVALIALLAHVGSFVPADHARIGLVDRIFTRIGASDELHSGQSTFMVEMTETANILHHATDRSLVVLDEIGRGTSTLDGLSLAWAITETLAARRARTLFATHYHELTALADRSDAVANLHVAVREWRDEIIFLHHIEPGRTDRSYGIHVARLAGLPRETVERAQTLLEGLSVAESTAADRVPPAPDQPPVDQLDLFGRRPVGSQSVTPSEGPPSSVATAPRSADAAGPPTRGSTSDPARQPAPHPAVRRLAATALETLTPLDAFDLLRDLIASARRDSSDREATEDQ